MKRTCTILFILALFLAVVNTANATQYPYLYTLIDSSTPYTPGPYGQISWDIDLDTEILDIGDVDLGDVLISAWLNFEVAGDSTIVNPYLQLTDPNLVGSTYQKSFITGGNTLVLTSLVTGTHQFNVTLERYGIMPPVTINELSFGGVYDNPGASAPEPTTILLLGSGLLGIAGFRRKFNKK